MTLTPHQPVTIDVLFADAAARIEASARALWPGRAVRLGAHLPSVTCYVQHVDVGGRALVAKISYLGVSLVSLLRGVRGDWPTVQAAQAAYLTAPSTLLDREATQLRLMEQVPGLDACPVAGVHSGVLFTGRVSGPTLADLLTTAPERTAELLGRVVCTLRALQHPPLPRGATVPQTPERGIGPVFVRKFRGGAGQLYLRQLGAERIPDDQEREQTRLLLTSAVERLMRLRKLPQPRCPALLHGDLKPEHLLFPHGAGGAPVFLDPGLQYGSGCTDTAKLLSRTLLHLLATPPRVQADRIVEGIDAFARGQARAFARPAVQELWLRQLVITWLMDTVNITSSYLSAPAALPLPTPAPGLLDRALTVATLADRGSALLDEDQPMHRLWPRLLDDVKALVRVESGAAR
ncbi:hypothetical protein AB0I22_19435 [Streptomyces sp. NPDC050610]|uniref:hypothetical protein n=1 Tax=Streptomyces sp. NPDC050610 TaxID=3157097 RepID=UPI00343EEC83